MLPWVTLFSDGRKRGTAKAAISQAAMTTQRNLTANAPIPPKMAWMRTRRAYRGQARAGWTPIACELTPRGFLTIRVSGISFAAMVTPERPRGQAQGILISVVIPVHGDAEYAEYLTKCLDSVLSQAAGSEPVSPPR